MLSLLLIDDADDAIAALFVFVAADAAMPLTPLLFMLYYYAMMLNVSHRLRHALLIATLA